LQGIYQDREEFGIRDVRVIRCHLTDKLVGSLFSNNELGMKAGRGKLGYLWWGSNFLGNVIDHLRIVLGERS
jgi:hypothetical protein